MTIKQRYDPAVPLTEIREHEDNPRRGDEAAIEASMEAHSFYGAVLVQERTNRIIAGNHRARVAARLGHETVPVIFLDVDDTQARRLMLIDNRSSDLGTYDSEALGLLLAELNRLEGGLGGTGWDEADLLQLLDAEQIGLGDPDLVPPVPATPRTQRGDLWVLGDHRVLCGDSCNPADVAVALEGISPRALVTDPPFMVEYDGSNHPQGWDGKRIDRSYTEIFDPAKYTLFLECALQHLDPYAVIYQWFADRRSITIYDAWEKNGLLLHQILYWLKSAPVMTRQHFKSAIEACAFGWLKGNQPEMDRRVPVGRANVWELPNLAANIEHPTIKPVTLWTDPFTWHLRGGEWGYDPFCGSGTAIIAAEMTGRRGVGIEISPAFVDVACTRWQTLTGDRPTLNGEPYDFQIGGDDRSDEHAGAGVSDLADHAGLVAVEGVVGVEAL